MQYAKTDPKAKLRRYRCSERGRDMIAKAGEVIWCCGSALAITAEGERTTSSIKTESSESARLAAEFIRELPRLATSGASRATGTSRPASSRSGRMASPTDEPVECETASRAMAAPIQAQIAATSAPDSVRRAMVACLARCKDNAVVLGSIEPKNPERGWRRIKVAMDSGAAESVIPIGEVPEYPPTPLEEAVYYQTASGETIANEGEQVLPVCTD